MATPPETSNPDMPASGNAGTENNVDNGSLLDDDWFKEMMQGAPEQTTSETGLEGGLEDTFSAAKMANAHDPNAADPLFEFDALNDPFSLGDDPWVPDPDTDPLADPPASATEASIDVAEPETATALASPPSTASTCPTGDIRQLAPALDIGRKRKRSAEVEILAGPIIDTVFIDPALLGGSYATTNLGDDSGQSGMDAASLNFGMEAGITGSQWPDASAAFHAELNWQQQQQQRQQAELSGLAMPGMQGMFPTMGHGAMSAAYQQYGMSAAAYPQAFQPGFAIMPQAAAYPAALAGTLPNLAQSFAVPSAAVTTAVTLEPVPKRARREPLTKAIDRVDRVPAEKTPELADELTPPSRFTPVKRTAESSRRTRSSSPEDLPPRDDVPQYRALERRPHSWTATNGITGATRRFRYTYAGELDHSIRLMPTELLDFLMQNPRRVTLRIGRVPLGCNERYGKDRASGDRGGAAKCRFKCCLDRKGTMEKGTYRVVMDEQRGTGDAASAAGANPHHDPFHNAGYVHLWCLERWLDLPALIRDPKVDVVIDDGVSRPLRGPRDIKCAGVRMSSESQTREAARFLAECQAGGHGTVPNGYPRCTDRGTAATIPADSDEDKEHGPYKGTLGHRMAMCKFELDSALNRHDIKRPKADHRAKSRFRDHLFDLAKQVPGRDRTRRPSGQKQIRSGKRRRESSVMREHLARAGHADDNDGGVATSKRIKSGSETDEAFIVAARRKLQQQQIAAQKEVERLKALLDGGHGAVVSDSALISDEESAPPAVLSAPVAPMVPAVHSVAASAATQPAHASVDDTGEPLSPLSSIDDNDDDGGNADVFAQPATISEPVAEAEAEPQLEPRPEPVAAAGESSADFGSFEAIFGDSLLEGTDDLDNLGDLEDLLGDV